MRSNLSVASLWVVVFLLGGIAGAVSHSLYKEHFTAAASAPAMPKPGEIVERMAREFNLDAQQKESLKNIFAQSRHRYRALGQEYRPQWEAIRNETDEQIKQMLRSDQRAKYEEFLKKVNATRLKPGQRPAQTSK